MLLLINTISLCVPGMSTTRSNAVTEERKRCGSSMMYTLYPSLLVKVGEE